MFKRYLVGNSRFIALVCKERFRAPAAVSAGAGEVDLLARRDQPVYDLAADPRFNRIELDLAADDTVAAVVLK